MEHNGGQYSVEMGVWKRQCLRHRIFKTMTTFRILSRDEENHHERELATETAMKVSVALGVPIPRIYFYRDNGEAFPWGARIFKLDDRLCRGVTLSPTEIALRRGLPDSEIIATTAHECRHVYQTYSIEWAHSTFNAREHDAESFARQFTAQERIRNGYRTHYR